LSYIGRGTESISNVEVLDNITFDGSSSYTLQKSSTNFVPSSANNLLISISGVVQQGNFSVSGSTITFDTVVSGSDTCDWILHYGIGLITTVADGTVTTAKLAGGLTVTHAVGSAGSPSITFDSDSNTGIFSPSADTIAFTEGGTEAMRIGSSGNILIAKSSSSFGTAGVELNVGNAKYNQFTRSGGGIVDFNRLADDGEILAFHQDSSKEGTISVSGATVSYNGFTGTHWSRLSDNSKPTILKGTILESLDEMMDWYQVQFDITKTDDEGNETTITKKESYELGDGESVGDVITYTYEDTDYQATIIQEGDVKHTKSKISDTVDAKNVYGVFMAWDNDDDTVNDMYVAQTGTFVVRMNSAETVSKGDLIQSNGDGTGKVQADDLLRASTVAKVLSTTKIETYEDGSFIVPCSLMC
jgi:hypothetical protein